ncbi:unnamed protein product [Rhodiola kirilowii]|jgi:hypothetical protein
MREN